MCFEIIDNKKITRYAVQAYACIDSMASLASFAAWHIGGVRSWCSPLVPSGSMAYTSSHMRLASSSRGALLKERMSAILWYASLLYDHDSPTDHSNRGFSYVHNTYINKRNIRKNQKKRINQKEIKIRMNCSHTHCVLNTVLLFCMVTFSAAPSTCSSQSARVSSKKSSHSSSSTTNATIWRKVRELSQ